MDRSVYLWHDQHEATHWWYCARRKIISSVISRFVAKGKSFRVLEAGCGTGGNLQMLSQFGKLSAFELDDTARDIAETKMPIGVKSGKLPSQIPFDNGKFELVTAFDVIEHVEQDVESLRALGERLTPDGFIVVTVPACPWLWSRHDEINHHFRRYTRKSLTSALEASGLKLVWISYFNTLLFPLVAGIRFIRVKLGLKETDDIGVPSSFINQLLQGIFASERWLVGRVPLPIGVSLLAVARRA